MPRITFTDADGESRTPSRYTYPVSLLEVLDKYAVNSSKVKIMLEDVNTGEVRTVAPEDIESTMLIDDTHLSITKQKLSSGAAA